VGTPCPLIGRISDGVGRGALALHLKMILFFVMAGLDPAIHAFLAAAP
jgi:hypothetical protein